MLMSLSGSQGMIKKRFFNGEKVVVKKSNYVDYTLELEKIALKQLGRLKMPHFCKLVDLKYKNGSPRLILKEINGSTLTEFSRDKSTSDEALLNVMYQTMIACEVMHRHLGMSHNDLHTGNVMIEPIKADVNVYRFENKTYAFETHGVCPVIIDFGFAYVKGLPKMITPACFTDIGYFPFEMDPLGDVRIFLANCISRLERWLEKPTNRSNDVIKFVDIARKLMYPLEFVNINKGWFENETFDSFMNYTKDVLFENYEKSNDKKEWGVFNPASECFDTGIELILANVEMKTESKSLVSKTEADCRKAFERFLEYWSDIPFDGTKDEELALFKKIMDKSDAFLTKTYGESILDILEIKRLAKVVTASLRDVLVPLAIKMSRDKSDKYSGIVARSMLEILDSFPKRAVHVDVDTVVNVYDCVNLDHYSATLTSQKDVDRIEAMICGLD